VTPKQIKTFGEYYAAYRCPSAPENPERALGLARKIYEDRFIRVLTPQEFMEVLFETLGIPGWGTKQRGKGVFHDFDPSVKRHDENQPAEKRFLSYFRGRLKQNLKAACEQPSDQGRLHPAYDPDIRSKPRIAANPTTTSYTREAKRRRDGSADLRTVVDPRAKEAEANRVREERLRLVKHAVEALPGDERLVIDKHYYKGHSFREIERRQRDLDRRLVSDLHQSALERIRNSVA
jgi:hypothetical protein